MGKAVGVQGNIIQGSCAHGESAEEQNDHNLALYGSVPQAGGKVRNLDPRKVVLNLWVAIPLTNLRLQKYLHDLLITVARLQL